jgi:hypothetical protein
MPYKPSGVSDKREPLLRPTSESARVAFEWAWIIPFERQNTRDGQSRNRPLVPLLHRFRKSSNDARFPLCFVLIAGGMDMTRRRLAVCVASALLVTLIASTTKAQSVPVPQSSATTRPGTFTSSLKKTVGLLRVRYFKANVPWIAEGTCFFVFYEDKRPGENGGFVYLVTNRHVASPGIEEGTPYPIVETHLRLNLRDSNLGSEESTLPIGAQLHWFFPADDG